MEIAQNPQNSVSLNRPLSSRMLTTETHTRIQDSQVYISYAFTIIPQGRTAVNNPVVRSMYRVTPSFLLQPSWSLSKPSC